MMSPIHSSMLVFTFLAVWTRLVLCAEFWEGFEEVTSSTDGSLVAVRKCGGGDRAGLDKCVPYHRCDGRTNTIVPENSLNKFGFGVIDIRIREDNYCTDPMDVCCKIPQQTGPTPTERPNPPEVVPPTDQPKPVTVACGMRNENGIDFKLTGNTHNEAEYGEFPWMVAIMDKEAAPSSNSSFAVCGGSLIASRVILTGAHCVRNYTSTPTVLKVRAGEWDVESVKERLPFQERNVEEIIMHPEFQKDVLLNDIALVVVSRPFKKAEHVGTICLPDQDERINSDKCYATGWGKNVFGRLGVYQMILKKIELPIVPRDACQSSLRETRLGSYFELHESFICAGGGGKDTCTGDGGSPLVCPDPKQPNRYVQAGLVSWGIGCGSKSPGVYADVAKFRNWVDKQMERLSFDKKPYID